MTTSRRPCVVAIDGARAARELWHELAARARFRITALDCRDATREELRAARPDIVVLDWSIACDPAAWSVLHALSIDASLQRVPVVICADGAASGERLPADDESVHILPKPFGVDDLLGMISSLLHDDRPTGTEPRRAP